MYPLESLNRGNGLTYLPVSWKYDDRQLLETKITIKKGANFAP